VTWVWRGPSLSVRHGQKGPIFSFSVPQNVPFPEPYISGEFLELD